MTVSRGAESDDPESWAHRTAVLVPVPSRTDPPSFINASRRAPIFRRQSVEPLGDPRGTFLKPFLVEGFSMIGTRKDAKLDRVARPAHSAKGRAGAFEWDLLVERALQHEDGCRCLGGP